MYYDVRGIPMALRLNRQTAVITGAGSAEGIGFAVARRLHSAGVRVVITSTTDRVHSRARELNAGGEGVFTAQSERAPAKSPMRIRPAFDKLGDIGDRIWGFLPGDRRPRYLTDVLAF
jgi:NAD(P)-dependent dehydrogenase (short-subunit alcohol dehydrogenase family)